MKVFKQGLLVAALILSNSVLACSEDGSTGFLPDNNLKISVGQKRKGGLTEEQFNAVIDKVEAIYDSIVTTEGGELNVDRNWTDGTVNAYASRSGKVWNVAMFGGLARHETITEDGFALVVCHELGHHIGGAPKKVSAWSNSWASNEGQSDYFANLKCLRRVFENDNSLRKVRAMKDVPEEVENKCKAVWETAKDRAICIRGSMAGLSVAKLFQSLRSASVEPKFETPDAMIVSRTNDNHPAYQCRLDTYFQGSLCNVHYSENVEQDDEVAGTCHGAIGSRIGTRPLCWFKPKAE
ncbi:MAG: hypothetical protein ACOVP4_07810 [Bacteriovoracaceae bacterium]